MSAGSVTGFQSWLEARPAGHRLVPVNCRLTSS